MKRIGIPLLVIGLAAPAIAGSDVVFERFDLNSEITRSADEYALARPLPLVRVSVAELGGSTVDLGVATKTIGSADLAYTSSRLIPPSAAEAWPYSTIGKLFITYGGETFTCSGAVIAPRLVVTAAQCVNGGPGVGFFRRYEFVPAYREGDAPLGRWTANAGFVTMGWYDDPHVPSSQDFAILQFHDQQGMKLAEVTGQLTHQLFQAEDDHLHLLGYAGNLDEGEQMHQVTSGDSIAFDDGTLAYGGDLGDGAAGGPWVQNFGVQARGQDRGLDPRPRAVVAINSYAFDDPELAAQGGAPLNGDFRRLMRFACGFQPGNC